MQSLLFETAALNPPMVAAAVLIRMYPCASSVSA
jgi:hypothetical protein